MPRFLVEDAVERGLFDTGESDGRWQGTTLGTARMRQLFVALAAAADDGDPVAGELLDGVAEAIATSLIETINLLDVNHVIFGGPFFAPVADYLLARVPGLVRADPTLVSPHPITFEASGIGEDVAAIGAACLVLDHALSPRPAGLLIKRG
jgi:predicted NBD/HSP70 family sugar kinase